MESKSKFALQARCVLPIESPPIAGGVVTIENGRIVAVGQRPEKGAPVQDLGDVVLMPGLVNAHTHLEFSHQAKPLGRPGMPLPEWIQLVIAHRKQQSGVVSGVNAGLQESLKAGVTTIGEIATSPFAVGTREDLPELIAFQEVIGFSAARIDSVFAELQQRLPSKHASPQVGISPHAPYTVHPKLLAKLVALASQRQLPMAMHLAESPEELQLLRDNQGPFRELLEQRSMWDDDVFASSLPPLDYLQVLAQSPRSLVVHGNFLSPREIEFVGEHRDRMSIVYCPRTHAFFEHDTYPLQAMLDAGVNVAIGTDSRASNPDLSLLGELRYLASVFEGIPPEIILKLGTLNGAEALGMAETVGSLVPGKLANLTTIPCDRSELSPISALLFGEQSPEQTWLRGRKVPFTEP